MSKTTTAGMDTHLAEEVTSLATCWRITRRDGVEFFFTDHDVDIVYDGNTYRADASYSRTAIQNDSTLAVDNLEVLGVFDSAEITEEDMRVGLFDYAQIRIFAVNWADLTDGDIKLRNGRLGEVTLTEQGIFNAELRGLTQMLSQNMIEVLQPECRADVGDNRCKLPVDPLVVLRETTYAVGDFVRVSTGAGTTQEQYENRIYECTRAGLTDASEPSYDTTPGNITDDVSVAATGVLTLTSNAGNNETVTLDAKVYTFQTVLTDVDGNVLIGATASDSLDNLIAAITLGAGAGTKYAASMTPHPTVTAAAGAGDTMDVTAKTAGAAGNKIVSTETLSNGSFGAVKLTGGVDGAIFTCRQSWMRHAVVATVTDRKEFTLTLTESRAVDNWFNDGAFEFEDGSNDGAVIEIRDWIQGTSTVKLFLPTPFTVPVGAKVRLYPGCDKRAATCEEKWAFGSTLFVIGNIKNFRGENFLPGTDELLRSPDAK